MAAWAQVSHHVKLSVFTDESALYVAFLNNVEVISFVSFVEDVLASWELDNLESIN